MATAEKPVTQRKLNREIRLKIAILASERFRAPALREKEAAAREEIVRVLYRDALAIPKKEIATLEKYGYTRQVRTIMLPYSITIPDEAERSFEKPDGTTVTRTTKGKAKSINRPGSDENELPTFIGWGQAIEVSPERGTSHKNGNEEIVLPSYVTVPGTGSGRYEKDRDAILKYDARLVLDGIYSEFLTPDVLAAIRAYYAIADERIRTERRLICAAVKVIASCDFYGQVLDFWPEVAEIEDQLYSGVIRNAFSLVALSDEDKAALCSNMGERGVPSNLCTRRAA